MEKGGYGSHYCSGCILKNFWRICPFSTLKTASMFIINPVVNILNNKKYCISLSSYFSNHFTTNNSSIALSNTGENQQTELIQADLILSGNARKHAVLCTLYWTVFPLKPLLFYRGLYNLQMNVIWNWIFMTTILFCDISKFQEYGVWACRQQWAIYERQI